MLAFALEGKKIVRSPLSPGCFTEEMFTTFVPHIHYSDSHTCIYGTLRGYTVIADFVTIFEQINLFLQNCCLCIGNLFVPDCVIEKNKLER